MQTFAVQPLVGVGPVHLGTSRNEVRRILGPCSTSIRKSPSSREATDAWFANGFQVFYAGEMPAVEYIGLSAGVGFSAMLFGHDVFTTPASTVVSLVQEHAAFDATDPELGSSYIFPSIELSLWRPDCDELEGNFFATVGIGIRGYYSQHDA